MRCRVAESEPVSSHTSPAAEVHARSIRTVPAPWIRKSSDHRRRRRSSSPHVRERRPGTRWDIVSIAHAIASEHEAGRIGVGIYELYRQALLGQMRRAGHQEGYVREVVHWAVTNRLGQEFSWRDIAADTDIGSKDTARRYVEDAEALFLWTLLHRARGLERTERALRSPKKIYPVDPFTWHVLTAWIVGGADPWALTLDRTSDPAVLGPLVEATAGAQLLRGFGARAMYYRAPRGEEEIDLVLHEERRRAQIEIKYRKSVRATDCKVLAAHGGGILATRQDRAWDPAARVIQIPVPYLLAGLGEGLSLYPARD